MPFMDPVRYTLLAACFALSACVAPPVALTPQLQQNLDSVQPVAFIPQANLDIDVTPGNAGGAGGLLGALIVAAIDEARRSKAEQASAGLVNTLRDFGFRERMARQMDAEFARLRAPRMAGPVQVEHTDSDSQRRILYDTSRASAVMFTNVSYKLVDAKLVVMAHSVIYPKAAKLQQFRGRPNNANVLDDGNVIYRKTFVFRSEAIAANAIRQSLAEGLANVAWQIAADMNHIAGSSDTARLAPLQPLGASSRPVAAASLAPPAVAPAPMRPAALHALHGLWSGSYRCGPFQGKGTADAPSGWTVKAEMSVQAGKATLVRGDASYREVLVGDVGADGSVSLKGTGSMRQTPDRPWHTQATGMFVSPDQGRFQGSVRLTAADGTALRDCTVDLAKTGA